MLKSLLWRLLGACLELARAQRAAGFTTGCIARSGEPARLRTDLREERATAERQPLFAKPWKVRSAPQGSLFLLCAVKQEAVKKDSLLPTTSSVVFTSKNNTYHKPEMNAEL